MTTDTDLVAELREAASSTEVDCGHLLIEAAALIDRLQREVERLSTTRQAIEDETLERAAVDLEMEISGVDVELRPTRAVDIIRSLKGTPPATVEQSSMVAPAAPATLPPDVLAALRAAMPCRELADRVHAANRPDMRVGMRVEVRDRLDAIGRAVAALSPSIRALLETSPDDR